MKSKPKTKLDYTDRDDLLVVQGFTEFLILIDVKAAEEPANEVQEIIHEDFCGQCEVHKDDCDCEKVNDYWRDDDYEYDRWKDDQLLEEKG